jgi:hypothetical protein
LPLEEEGRWDTENTTDFMQATGTDTVDPLFILLNLLVRDAQPLAELLLRHANQDTAHTDPRANMAIN